MTEWLDHAGNRVPGPPGRGRTVVGRYDQLVHVASFPDGSPPIFQPITRCGRRVDVHEYGQDPVTCPECIEREAECPSGAAVGTPPGWAVERLEWTRRRWEESRARRDAEACEPEVCRDGTHVFPSPVRGGSHCVCGSLRAGGPDVPDGGIVSAVVSTTPAGKRVTVAVRTPPAGEVPA